MNTYTWDCATVDVHTTHNELSDVVFNVHWRLTCTDDESGLSTTSIGTQNINVDEINAEEFIEVGSLTNEILTSWVVNAIGEEEIDRMKESLQNILAEMHAPTKKTIRIEVNG